MLSYILRRLASTIPTLFVVVTISFFLIRLRRAARSTSSSR